MGTPTPTPGFAPAPVNSNQWNSQVVEAQAQARVAATQDRLKAADGYTWIPDFIKKPVEWAGAAWHYVYSNVISRPISTAFLATYIGSAEADSNAESWANLFNGDIWDRAYQDAKHVSPGQAVTFGLERFVTNTDVREAMKKPEIVKFKDEYGRESGANLNQNGYIWDNPDAVKAHFDSGVQKWVSGGLDFYTSWYADPLAIVGKGVGAFRKAAYVRPAVDVSGKSNLLGTLAGKKAGQISENVTKNLQSSAFNQMGNLIEAQKTKLGDAFPEWVTRQNWAKNSPDAGAVANALHRAKDRSEVDNVLAIAAGDRSVINPLRAKNEELAAQMEALKRQQDGAIASAPVNPTQQQAAQLELQLQAIADDMTRIDQQTKSIGVKLAVEDSFKNGLYFMPGVSKVASNFGQYARGLETKSAAGTSMVGRVPAWGLTLAYNNLYVRPVRVLSGTTWNGVRAPGHIDIEAADAHRAVTANLEQSKVWSPDEIRAITSRFLTSNKENKGLVLQTMDAATVTRIADKYGMNADEAAAIYRQLGGMRGRARDGQVYSTANVTLADGRTVRADHVDDAGNLITVSPLLNTQLQNTQILTDYEHLSRVLKYTARPFRRLLKQQEIEQRATSGVGPLTKDQASEAARNAVAGLGVEAGAKLGPAALKTLEVGKEMSEVMGKLWKFNVLFRVGYGPRAIADDWMGQAARFGAWNFFVDRTLVGARNASLRNWNRVFNDPAGWEQKIASMDSGIAVLTERAGKYQQKIDHMASYLPPSTSYVGKGKKGRQQLSQRAQVHAEYTQKLKDTTDQLNYLKGERNRIGAMRNSLGDNYILMDDGTALPRPYEGVGGQIARDRNSGRRTVDSLLGGTASDLWNYYRSGAWDVVTTADPGRYTGAWGRVVNLQLKQDEAVKAYLNGKPLREWFRTQEGRAYRDQSAVKSMTPEEHADRIEATVDHMLPPNATPETAALRQAVAIGASDEEVMRLMNKVRLGDGPVGVQAEGVAYSMGKGDTFQHIDNLMNGFYDKVNRLPSEILSRNPLFFQLYRQHATEIYQLEKDAGKTHLTPRDQERIANKARELSIRDVKKLTFNMDFESKLAYKMRFIAPFFGPMQESFTRWGRIAADKPEILAHATNIYTSPIRAGHAVDQDGNEVGEDGYVTLPNGERKLVKKGDMHIQFQAPQWLAKSIGMDQGSIIDMPIDTLNLVLQNDPWYNPGTGPWVQLPANWVALRADAQVGDTMKDLGILQRTTPNSISQLTGSMPKLVYAILGGEDGDQQQRDMAYLMQSENYKWQTGLRDKEPTWDEIKERVSHAAGLRAWMKVVLPVSSDFKDPYQFFRDRYNELRNANPNTADQVFLAKYGDAAFVFTGALTTSKKGLPATVQAVRADKRFAPLIQEDPDLAQLIVGPYSSGDFSQTAYVQQMQSGDRKVNDAADVMRKAQANLGWAQYDKYMNMISSQMYQAGFTTFDQPGAERFNNMRRVLVKMLTSPTMPDGSKNTAYNEEFSKAFLTVDRGKDERLASKLNDLVKEKSLIGDETRSDIKKLATYLDNRNALKKLLNDRDRAGGSADINARSNWDLRRGFADSIMAMREADTQFQALHDRWLGNDMFDHFEVAGVTE